MFFLGVIKYLVRESLSVIKAVLSQLIGEDGMIELVYHSFATLTSQIWSLDSDYQFQKESQPDRIYLLMEIFITINSLDKITKPEKEASRSNHLTENIGDGGM